MAIVVVLLLAVALCGLLVLCLAALGLAMPRPGDRQAIIRTEAMGAEARIDFLTRRAMQQMRDTVRSELRDEGDGRE
ncbi:MAG: hypothetical protein QOH56_2703 [Pseudonocardiales bacterium]|jgi:hypothetical protein|nr:hypothetical protein [Pseudonocardiales bacterium]